MICYTYRIPYTYGETIQIRPIADAHYGHLLHSEKHLKDFLAENPKAYFIGLGDLIDSIIVKDAKRYQKSMDTTKGDTVLDEQIEGIYKILKPYVSRIIGLCKGNHENYIVKYCSTDPIRTLCNKLSILVPERKGGIKHLGTSFLIKLIFSCKGSSGRTVMIYGHHGKGTPSTTEGGDITKYSKAIPKWDANIYIFGHVHRKAHKEVSRGSYGRNDKIVAKNQHLIICGSFQKTVTDTEDTSYAEEYMFPLANIGGVCINITPDSHAWCKIKVDT